jgi:PAS domain S-box-containing protein
MEDTNFLGIKPIKVLLAALILGGLYLTSLYSYLLFHTLAELFSILIGGTIFVLAWNFRRFFNDSFLVFVGTSYLFFSLIDLAHTLVYYGMGIFQGYDANTPTQLWIAARSLQAVSLLAAPLFLGRKVKVEWLLAGFTLVTSLLLLSIFVWDTFPVCYIEGVGLTPFKIISEYLIDLILVAAVVLLLQKRSYLDPNVLRLLILSTLFTITGELFFTFYIDVYGLMNLVGHFCKIIASYLIYKAIVETAATSIYTDMTRIRQAESALRESEERYRMLFNTMLNGFALHEIICNQDGTPIDYRFLEVNPAFERLTGLIGKEIVGKTVRVRLPGTETYWIDSYGQVALSGVPIQFENYSSALEKHYQVFAFSPRENQFATIFTDITGRRRAETALEAYTQQLERSNQDLEEFASIASHDLQEPLRKIETFGSLLQDSLGEGLGQTEGDYLDRMQKAAQRMRTMVNGLLVFSRSRPAPTLCASELIKSRKKHTTIWRLNRKRAKGSGMITRHQRGSHANAPPALKPDWQRPEISLPGAAPAGGNLQPVHFE